MVLNNVTKFHKILIKIIRLRERTSFQMVNFNKQRAITTIRLRERISLGQTYVSKYVRTYGQTDGQG